MTLEQEIAQLQAEWQAALAALARGITEYSRCEAPDFHDEGAQWDVTLDNLFALGWRRQRYQQAVTTWELRHGRNWPQRST